MQAIANIYVCRRCEPPREIRDYNGLRTHLRAAHRIKQVLNSEIVLYEAFQGSRFTQPPFKKDGSEVDEVIQIRDEMLRTVQHTINESVSFISVPTPTTVIDFGQIHRSLSELRNDIEGTIQTTIQRVVQESLAEMRDYLHLLKKTNDSVGVNVYVNDADVLTKGQTKPLAGDEDDPKIPDDRSDSSSDVSMVIDTSSEGKGEEHVSVQSKPPLCVGKK